MIITDNAPGARRALLSACHSLLAALLVARSMAPPPQPAAARASERDLQAVFAVDEAAASFHREDLRLVEHSPAEVHGGTCGHTW